MSKNEELGLPTAKMRKLIAMFDVDGTLISNKYAPYHPNERVRNALIFFASCKNIDVGVWSGRGEHHAYNATIQLGLLRYVKSSLIMDKKEAYDSGFKPDFAIDDMQDSDLGKYNMIVREK